ncbi:hypothetical protein TNCV_2117741 [Trichonephila clavipes]|nr:hypothetical protein TNCV_2117741 [Trichonephila clavipes]
MNPDPGGYKPADTGESCRSSRSSHGGDSISACSVSSDKIPLKAMYLIKKLNLRIDEISSRSRSRNRNSHFINVIALNQKHTSSAGTITNLAQQLKNVTLHVNSQKTSPVRFYNLHGTKIYSHIDLVKAYHQIPINPDDVHKSAIITPFGLFESTRMQFGLCDAAATFQRFIDEVLRNLPFVFAFVDDILVASSSPEEHLQHLQILFTRLQHIWTIFKAL